MEGVADPYHRETVGNLRNQVWSVVTLEFNALIEIVNGFPKPHTNDQKRGDACTNSFQSEVVEMMLLWRTNHETKNTNPSRHPLDHGLIEGSP